MRRDGCVGQRFLKKQRILEVIAEDFLSALDRLWGHVQNLQTDTKPRPLERLFEQAEVWGMRISVTDGANQPGAKHPKNRSAKLEFLATFSANA